MERVRNYNDISILDTTKGGDLEFFKDDIVLTAGLRNNVYLSLFGGNVEESSDRVYNTGEKRFDWWGNSVFFENDTKKQFNSRTEKALREVAVTSSGRSIIQNAVIQDLQALTEVANIFVAVTLQSVDRIKITITVTEKETGITTELEYLWDAVKREEADREFRDSEPIIEEPVVPNRSWLDGQGNVFTDGQGNAFTY